MTSQTGYLTIKMHMCIAGYLRKKSNETVKFGQLTEYNMRIIFLEKSCTKYDG